MSDLFNTTFSAAGISVYYGTNCAVDNVSFDLKPGQLNAVIGNNGCGKTSLIKAIMGLIKHNGQCQLNEHLLENLSVKKNGPADKLHSTKKQSYHKHDRQGGMSAWLQSSYAHTWRLHHRYDKTCR